MFFRNTVALNIDTNLARLLSVRQGMVRQWGEKVFPPNAVKDAQIMDPEAVAMTLDDLFKSTDLSRKGVLVSISGFRSLARMITLPKIGRALLKEAIFWAARKELSVPVEEFHLSWQIVNEQDAEQSVFLVSTPQRIVAPLHQALKLAAIKPRAVELKPISLARLVNQTEAIAVDLEKESTTIVIIANGIPEIMHTVLVRNDDLLFEERAEMAASDLARAIGFYNHAHPQQKLGSETAVFLTGALMSRPKALRVMRNIMGHHVETPSFEIKHDAGFPALKYAVNVGLVQRAMPAEKTRCGIKIDLIPD